jgi:hypothetical protein
LYFDGGTKLSEIGGSQSGEHPEMFDSVPFYGGTKAANTP